jgi:hypothetical protein
MHPLTWYVNSWSDPVSQASIARMQDAKTSASLMIIGFLILFISDSHVLALCYIALSITYIGSRSDTVIERIVYRRDRYRSENPTFYHTRLCGGKMGSMYVRASAKPTTR